MKRLCEIVRIMFDRVFWREFTELDMREETGGEAVKVKVKTKREEGLEFDGWWL